MMYHSSEQSGFSLVETLVAITILLLVIVGPMTISSTTARSTSFSSEQVVAFFLAQEGAELAQKARDDLLVKNFLPSSDGAYIATPWDTFTDPSLGSDYGACFDTDGCALEIDTDSEGTVLAVEACSFGNCNLFYDTSGDRTRYTHDPGPGNVNEQTPYTRVIKMERDGYEVAVTSTVFWRTGDIRQAQEVEVTTYLFDVYGN